jgi:hypothetical protein
LGLTTDGLQTDMILVTQTPITGLKRSESKHEGRSSLFAKKVSIDFGTKLGDDCVKCGDGQSQKATYQAESLRGTARGL